MATMGWPGQFNLDFMCMLTLSGLWVAWRHHFSGAGIALGLLAFFGGALPHRLSLCRQPARQGECTELLLGQERPTE